MGSYGIEGSYFQLNTATGGTLVPGMFSWNGTDGTADLMLKGGNVTLQIGQEQLVRVINKTGADLLESEYKVVRVIGATANRLKVDLALASGETTSVETIGIVTENISLNQEGFVTTSGLVRHINTTGSLQGETWADGDMLYLSPSTFGAITNIKPQAPNHLVILGYVANAGNNGSIYVKVDNGYELNELHNVAISGQTNNDLLAYDSSLNLWKNRSAAFLSLTTGSGTATQLAFWSGATGTTSTALTSSTGLTWDNVNGRLGVGTNNPTAKLQIVGAGTGSTTTAFRIQNSGGTNLLEVLDNGRINQTLQGSPSSVAFGIGAASVNTSSGVTANGVDAGRNATGFNWVAQGYQAGFNSTTGNNWVAQGSQAGFSNTTGINWVAQGVQAGFSNSIGSFWVALGSRAANVNTSGSNWIAIGASAAFNNTSGANWIAQGFQAALHNLTGDDWVAQGYQAAAFQADGASSAQYFRNSVYIGSYTRATNGTVGSLTTNETVVGYQAIGLGSNTSVIGNANTIQTWLGGNLTLGSTVASGTTRLKVTSSGSTNASFVARFQNSGGTDLMVVDGGGGVGIGTSLNNTSAILQADSTSRGFLPPRMSTTEKNNISTPAAGLVVYDSTLNNLNVYNGTAWTSTLSGSGAATRVAFWDGTSSLSSSSNLTWNNIASSLVFNGTYPGFEIIPSGWSGSKFFFQAGTDITATVAGDYSVFYNQSNKGFSFVNQTLGALNVIFGSTGNQVIQRGGTFTDGGYKLDINALRSSTGGLRVSGIGTTTAPTLLLQNSGSTQLFRVDDGGAVKIGTGTNNTSAILQIDSTTRGFLPPRVTTTEKGNIASPTQGLVVYDTTMQALSVYNGTNWATAGGGEQMFTVSATTSTINFNSGNIMDVVLASSTTLTLTGGTFGTFILKLTQDAVGGRTVSWPSTVRWSGGIPPTLTTSPSKTDIISFIFDGSLYYGTYALNF